MERALPVPRAGEPLDEPGPARRGDGRLKRIYFLVAIAVLQIIAGSFLLLGAAQPVRMSPDVLVPSGTYYHVEFGILGTGQMSGNLSELQSRYFDLFGLDAPGYASFPHGPISEPVPGPASDPAPDPVADPAPDPAPPEAPQVPPDDNTRIY